MDKNPLLCIFCCKQPLSFLIQGNFSAKRKFLKLFSRYLRINIKTEQLVDQLKFEICDECFHLAVSFCDLHFQYEVIKLKLDWKVKKILEAMKTVGSVPSHCSALANQFPDDDDGSNLVLDDIQLLRRDLLKHCEMKLKSPLPNVVLTRRQSVIKTCGKSGWEKLSVEGKCTITKSDLIPFLMTYMAVLHLSLPLYYYQISEGEESLNQVRTDEEEYEPILGPFNHNCKVVINDKEVETDCPTNLNSAEDHLFQTAKDVLPNNADDCNLERQHNPESICTASSQTTMDITPKQMQHLSGPDLNTLTTQFNLPHNSPESWYCAICPSSFSSWEEFVCHELTKHENSEWNDKIYQCTKCRELFIEKETFMKHFLIAHETEIKQKTAVGESQLLLPIPTENENPEEPEKNCPSSGNQDNSNQFIFPSNPEIEETIPINTNYIEEMEAEPRSIAKAALQTDSTTEQVELPRVADLEFLATQFSLGYNCPKQWLCYTCPASFSTQEELVWDELSNHGENIETDEENEATQIFKCTRCPQLFKTKEMIIKHVIKHHQPTSTREPVIGESQESISTTNMEPVEIAAEPVVSECSNDCPSKYSNNLSIPISKPKTVFTCNFCNIQFGARYVFLQHMVWNHARLFGKRNMQRNSTNSANMGYICPEVDCMVHCPSKLELSNHIWNHANENNQTSNGEDQRNSSNLEFHQESLSATGNKEPVPVADIVLPLQETMDRGETMDSSISNRTQSLGSDSLALLINSIAKQGLKEPRVLRHKCDFVGCKRAFPTIYRLKQHQQSHNRRKPYCCPWEGCRWKSVEPSLLSRHYRRHSKPHWCIHCLKPFTTKSGMSRHLKKIHGMQTKAKCLFE